MREPRAGAGRARSATSLLGLLLAVTGGVPAGAEDLVALSHDPGQWVMPAKNYAATRYSELDQINTETVKYLRLEWSFSIGVDRGQEAAPIVVGDTMYVVGTWSGLIPMSSSRSMRPMARCAGAIAHRPSPRRRAWPAATW